MILNVRNYKLDKYNLSKQNLRLLLLLSDNNFHSKEEIDEFIEGYFAEGRCKNRPTTAVGRLKKKITELEIVSKNGFGYKLLTEIKIIY